MESRDAYLKKLQAQLDEWAAEMAKLKAKADMLEADSRIELHKQIDRIREQQADARARMDELAKAGDEAWDDLTAGMEKAWDDLRAAMESAAARFK